MLQESGVDVSRALALTLESLDQDGLSQDVYTHTHLFTFTPPHRLLGCLVDDRCMSILPRRPPDGGRSRSAAILSIAGITRTWSNAHHESCACGTAACLPIDLRASASGLSVHLASDIADALVGLVAAVPADVAQGGNASVATPEVLAAKRATAQTFVPTLLPIFVPMFEQRNPSLLETFELVIVLTSMTMRCYFSCRHSCESQRLCSCRRACRIRRASLSMVFPLALPFMPTFALPCLPSLMPMSVLPFVRMYALKKPAADELRAATTRADDHATIVTFGAAVGVFPCCPPRGGRLLALVYALLAIVFVRRSANKGAVAGLKHKAVLQDLFRQHVDCANRQPLR